MKKSLIVILAALMLITVFLAACESEPSDESSAEASLTESADPSDETSEESDESAEESASPESDAPDSSSSAAEDSSAAPEESSESEESEESNPPVSNALSVYTCRYTAKPYYVIVGQCAEGAVISGSANGVTEQTKSHKGWFALRLNTDTAGTAITLKQTVGGKQIGASLSYKANPEKPGGSMWGIIVGDNSQFFLEKSSYDYTGYNMPVDDVFDMMADRVSRRVRQLKNYKSDAEIIYMIVPSPMTVYPELVPDNYKKADTLRIERTMEYLEKAGATVINLVDAFEKHKNDEMPLYFKTDSHWSDYGAFVAYTELFNHISKKFPAATPRKASDFNWNPDYYQGGDMAYYLAKDKTEALKFQEEIREYAYYRTFKDAVPMVIKNAQRYQSADKLAYSDEVTYKRTLRTYEEGFPNCLVMRDSFSTQIYDILAERTYQTAYYGMWDYSWNFSDIRNNDTDYVIYIVSEWNVEDVISY